METAILIGLLIFVIISTIFIFYNTIITKKWRDQAINEKKSWKLGFIYYNPFDKRIILPKRTGLGITFNFARPAGAISVFAILTVIVVYIVVNI